MKNQLLLLLLMLSFFSCAHKYHEGPHRDKLNEIVQMDHRKENSKRDEFRNPVDTLLFFDIQPSHHVLEISPGGGWYTEILAPYLKNHGKLTLAVFSVDSPSEYRQMINKRLKDKLSSSDDLYGKVELTVFEPPQVMELPVEKNSIDRIVTFRNVHSWMRSSSEQEVFNVFYEALAPGGILGVVQHRLKGEQEDFEAKSGYVSQDYVIELARNAGFKLVASSEINANPKDLGNHPNGVWTLPPALRAPEDKTDHYLSIGESDRMTLKFRK